MTDDPPLSHEQRHAVDRALTGHALAIVARAGSGKTHTLRAIARDTDRPRTLLLAFNRTVARDARPRLPDGARATTVHGLAFRSVVAGDARMRAKLRRAHEPGADEAWRAATGLDARDPTAAAHVAAIRAVLRRFLSAEAATPCPQHVPPHLATLLESELGSERWHERRTWLLRRAERLWRRIADPDDPVPLPHDGYLKLFAERRLPAPAELLLVDEAQDLAPVTLGWLNAQRAQTVLVGDPAQRIYGWRGAVDAMAASGHPEARLTQSFRFGASLASVARRVLAVLSPGARLTGAGPPGRVVVEPSGERNGLPTPRAVLCRGNAGVLEAVLAHADVGVHVVGGLGSALLELETAHALWCRRDADAPAASRAIAGAGVAGLASWADLVRASELDGGPLRTVRSLVERYGDELPLRLRVARRALRTDAAAAALTVSTIHRAKGREWDHVELWHDLARIPAEARGLAAAPDPERAREEANLLYVAVTRPKRTLLLGRLRADLKDVLAPDGSPD